MSEQSQDIRHGKFRSALSALKSRLSQLAFHILELEDALFDGIGNGEFVDYNVARLVQAVNAVDGLFFDKLRH
jgi:hypothetical protein